MRVLSLYDGISCGQEALKRAGIDVSEYYACEIEKHAVAITQHNFPNTVQLGNVFDVDFSSLGEFDLVIGGSPCTFWAICKRDRETTSEGMGFDLFMRFVDAVKQTKAKYFLYENNFSIHKDIKDAITDKLGVEHIMIDSALVSGQRRKRCYWFGKIDNGKATTVNVEQPQDKGILLQDILTSGLPYQDKSHCLTASYSGAVFWNSIIRKQRTMVAEPLRLGHYGGGGQGQRIYSVEGKSINLTSNSGGKGGGTGLYKIDLPDGEYQVRKLTPLEAERLQTLPDNFTKYGAYDGVKKEVADTNRLRAIGNGWTVEVISHILKHMS